MAKPWIGVRALALGAAVWLGAANVPALAVIDPQRRVRFKRVGFNPAETVFRDDLVALIERISDR